MQGLLEDACEGLADSNGARPSPFIETKPARALTVDEVSPAASSKWNLRGDCEEIPEEMFVLVFGEVEQRDRYALSMVCQRFHRIVFRPMNALLISTATLAFDVTLFFPDELPTGWSTNLLASPVFHSGKFHAKAMALQTKSMSFPLDVTGSEKAHFDVHAGHHVSVAQRVGDVFNLLTQHPWLRAMFTRAHCRRLRWYELECAFTVNLAWVKDKWTCDATETPRTVINAMLSVLFGVQHEFHAAGSASHHMRMCLTMLEDKQFNRHFLPSEPMPISLDALAIQVDLHPYQRSAVEWLRQREHSVLMGESLGTYDFHTAPHKLIGTGLRVSVLGESDHVRPFTDTPDSTSPVLHATARGVVIADQVGLGKTRETVAFVLGTRQDVSVFADCQQDETASVPRDRLILTRAVDFGANQSDFQCVVANGLIHTRASLIVVPTTMVNAWTNEIRAAYPDKKLLVFIQKSDHQKCTYLELATADVVLVTAHFLTNRKYYSTVRWSEPESKSQRTSSLLLALQLESFGRFFQRCGDLDALARAKAPCLEYFAWERVVADEIHQFVDPNVTPTFLEMSLNFFSARFVVVLSATFSASSIGSGSAGEQLVRWLGLGVDASDDCLRELGPKTIMRRGYSTPPSKTLLLSSMTQLPTTHYGTANKKLFPSWTSIFFNDIAHLLVRSIYRRNTQCNTTDRVFVPAVDDVVVSYKPHILAHVVAHMVSHLGMSTLSIARMSSLCLSRANIDDDGPKDSDKYLQRLHLATNYQTLFDEAIGRVETIAERVRVLAFAMECSPATALSNDFYSFTSDPFYATNGLMMQHMTVSAEAVCHALRGLRERMKLAEYFNPVEREFGTKVYLLDQYLRHIFTQSPDAKVIVASVYAAAMKTLLHHLLGPMGKSFVSIGGFNAGTTRKNERAFTHGNVQVLYINMNQAADGLNLQCASYIIEFDGTFKRNHPKMVQLYGRVQRQGSRYYPVIIHLKQEK